jgi:hypothetical protein
MADLIPLGGMKFSEELALVVLSADAPPPGDEVDVLRALAGQEVNLFYLSVSRTADRTRVSLCVAADRIELAERLAAQAAGGLWACRSVASVGLLTFYPHARRLEALKRSLEVFAASRLPVFGVASTLSALTFVTAFAELERASDSLREAFGLPPNHAPFKPEFRVKPVTR